MLGGFDNEAVSLITIEYFNFFIYSFFITIVLLNLLIAITGDTFDKETSNREASSYKERAQMLLDFELIHALFYEDHPDKRTYFYILKYLSKGDRDNNSNEWEGKMKTFARKMGKIQATVEELAKNQQQELDKKMQELAKNQQELVKN